MMLKMMIILMMMILMMIMILIMRRRRMLRKRRRRIEMIRISISGEIDERSAILVVDDGVVLSETKQAQKRESER